MQRLKWTKLAVLLCCFFGVSSGEKVSEQERENNRQLHFINVHRIGIILRPSDIKTVGSNLLQTIIRTLSVTLGNRHDKGTNSQVSDARPGKHDLPRPLKLTLLLRRRRADGSTLSSQISSLNHVTKNEEEIIKQKKQHNVGFPLPKLPAKTTLLLKRNRQSNSLSSNQKHVFHATRTARGPRKTRLNAQLEKARDYAPSHAGLRNGRNSLIGNARSLWNRIQENSNEPRTNLRGQFSNPSNAIGSNLTDSGKFLEHKRPPWLGMGIKRASNKEVGETNMGSSFEDKTTYGDMTGKIMSQKIGTARFQSVLGMLTNQSNAFTGKARGNWMKRVRREASTESQTVKVDWGLGRNLKVWEIVAIVAGCGLFVTLVIIGLIWSCCTWNGVSNPPLPTKSPYGGVEADRRRPSMMNPHHNQRPDGIFKREALRSGAADGTPYYGSRRGTQLWSPKPDDTPNQKNYLLSPTPAPRAYTPGRNSFSMVPVIIAPQEHTSNPGVVQQTSPVFPHRREIMEPIQRSPVQERRLSGASLGRGAAFPTINEKETLSSSPSPEPKTPKKYEHGRRSGRSVRRISAISMSENMETFKHIPWGEISAPKDAFGAG